MIKRNKNSTFLYLHSKAYPKSPDPNDLFQHNLGIFKKKLLKSQNSKKNRLSSSVTQEYILIKIFVNIYIILFSFSTRTRKNLIKNRIKRNIKIRGSCSRQPKSKNSFN